jgi:hypothetical protein
MTSNQNDEKLLTGHRNDVGQPRVFIRALGEIPIIRYSEDCSHGGHTITLTFPANVLDWYVPVHPADAQA